MKKKTKTNINKNTNRGRPPKKFISKKPQIKRDKPGRPKKHEKIILPQIPEKKENKIKDAIIWGLFIISFIVFGFSLYVSQKEKILALVNQNTKTIIEETAIEIGETEKEIIIEDTILSESKPEPTPAIVKDEKFEILEQIYGSIREARFNDMYIYIDSNLKQSSIFKTYFSKNRLQRFIDNIDNQNINIELIGIDEEQSQISYKLTYSIKNIEYMEDRETTFTSENKISKIMCITKGCSKMPFFNPGKYF